MSDFQITCIHKRDRQNPHERIQSVGGVSGGKKWEISQQDAIHNIETLGNRFWTSVDGTSVWVIVATHNGNKYIKTANDGTQENNLLRLVECPLQ